MNTDEGSPAASVLLMQLAPTAPDVHHEQLDDKQLLWLVMLSQDVAMATTMMHRAKSNLKIAIFVIDKDAF